MDKITELTKKVLNHRGMLHLADSILQPTIDDLPKSPTITGLDDASLWFLEQLDGKKPLLIFGDYDVDGISASAILGKFFRSLGFQTNTYIPSRLTDGYGLKLATIAKLEIEQYEGILVVDSGTNSHDVHSMLTAKQIPTLILDHHTVERTPLNSEFVKIINPRLNNEFYACSATLAYLFVSACIGIEKAEEYVGVAAMASITDRVPVCRTNHAIIKYGISKLSMWTGLRAMLQSLDIGLATTEAVGWRIGPRLNAPGRMGDATPALELLMTNNTKEAAVLLKALEKCNTERKKLQDTILQEASSLASLQVANGAILVTGDWHIGVLGIVAAKLTELYNVPALVATAGPTANGSGRTSCGYNLIELLNSTGTDRQYFGGHAGAVGIHIPSEMVEKLRIKFQEAARNAAPTSNTRKIEAIITTKEVNRLEAYAIECLGPFGEGFEEPIFGLFGKVVEDNGKIFIQDSKGKCAAVNLEPTEKEELIPIFIRHSFYGTQAVGE